MNYAPTPAEARRDLRRWSRGRKDLQEIAKGEELPLAWVAIAADVLLEALEQYEEANEGMVVTDLNTERS